MLKRLVAATVTAAALLLATATLQDEGGKSVVLTVEDKVTLDKFADKRISVGDEIKAKYTVKDGKSVATYFKKPGGC